ncbi:MAG: beta-ketoacyl-ACP synthase III [Planctomycetota bacterium]
MAVTLTRVGIAGTGSELPTRVVTNDDMARLVDTSDEWIVQRTGIRERRWVDEGQNCSHLCQGSARKALEAAGVAPDEVDLVVVGSLTQDHLMPSVACLVQSRLGLVNAAAFDVLSACTGFLTALHTAESFVAAGRARTALAIGGETLSRYLDLTDRGSCILFGDGSGAAVVRPLELCGEGGGQGEILNHKLGADGSGYDFIHIPEGGAEHPHNHPDYDASNHFIRVKGREVYRFAVTKMAEMIRSACGSYDPSEIKLVIPHQVNQRIIEGAQERLGWPLDKFFVNIHKYGNTSAASVPIALDEAVREGRLQRGDKVILVAFGAGLTWGSTLIQW